MKFKALGVVACLSLLMVVLPSFAQEQDYNEGLKEELNQEIDELYPKRPKQTHRGDAEASDGLQVQTVRSPRVKPAQAGIQNQSQAQVQIQQSPATQPIYILQQPTAVPQAQQQPTTTVEASAVRETKSEARRKQREDVERQTEDKMFERLEDDRLISEKDRSDRLMAPLDKKEANTAAASAASANVVATGNSNTNINATPVAVTPVQVQSETVAPSTEVVGVSKLSTKEEAFDNKEEGATKFRVGALAGIGSYPSASNVNGAYAAGVSVDMLFDDRLGIEASGLFSSYDQQRPTFGPYFMYSGTGYITTVNQINIDGGVNYRILEGRVSPVVGALIGYTRRTFSDRVTLGYYSNPTRGSNAFDGGFLVGVDVNATKRLTVGADFRYLMNLSYRLDDPLAYQYYPQIGDALESLNYYFITLSLKLAL